MATRDSTCSNEEDLLAMLVGIIPPLTQPKDKSHPFEEEDIISLDNVLTNCADCFQVVIEDALTKLSQACARSSPLEEAWIAAEEKLEEASKSVHGERLLLADATQQLRAAEGEIIAAAQVVEKKRTMKRPQAAYNDTVENMKMRAKVFKTSCDAEQDATDAMKTAWKDHWALASEIKMLEKDLHMVKTEYEVFQGIVHNASEELREHTTEKQSNLKHVHPKSIGTRMPLELDVGAKVALNDKMKLAQVLEPEAIAARIAGCGA